MFNIVQQHTNSLISNTEKLIFSNKKKLTLTLNIRKTTKQNRINQTWMRDFVYKLTRCCFTYKCTNGTIIVPLVQCTLQYRKEKSETLELSLNRRNRTSQKNRTPTKKKEIELSPERLQDLRV